MKLEQSFEVAASPERVWEALIDIERVAPCLPGATVLDRNGDGSYNGEFKVKIGPTSAAYSGRLTLDEADADARRCTLQAAGTDKRGQGGAKATIVSTVSARGDGASVEISSDYHITGRLARFGRGGMIEEISGRLLTEFADNLAAMLAGAGAPAAAAAPTTTPVEELPAEPPPIASAPPADPEPIEPAVPDAVQTGDPDAVIEGAMPVADVLAQEPATPDPTPAGPPPPSASDPRPDDAGSPTGALAVGRVKDNPAPFVALVFGFLLALRVLRRRS